MVQNVLSGWESERGSGDKDCRPGTDIAGAGDKVQGKDSFFPSVSTIFCRLIQSFRVNSDVGVVVPYSLIPRVSGLYPLPGIAGASAERSALSFSQSSYKMAGGDSPIF